jgi:hypothetical protein
MMSEIGSSRQRPLTQVGQHVPAEAEVRNPLESPGGIRILGVRKDGGIERCDASRKAPPYQARRVPKAESEITVMSTPVSVTIVIGAYVSLRTVTVIAGPR